MAQITSHVDIIPLSRQRLRHCWIHPEQADPRELLLEIKRMQLVFGELSRLYGTVEREIPGLNDLIAAGSVRSVLDHEVDDEAKTRKIERIKHMLKTEASDRRRGNDATHSRPKR